MTEQSTGAAPTDRDALGLVEAILDRTRDIPNVDKTVLAIRMSVIREKALCLKKLLAERDAAARDTRLMLAKTLGALQGMRDGLSDHHLPSVDAIIVEADGFLTRVKEAPNG